MGAGRTLGSVGGVFALAVGALVWFVMQDGESPADGRGGAADVEGGPTAPGKGESGRPGRRSGPVGTATVAGTVKRRDGAALAAGQTVTLVSPSGEIEAECGDEGRFAFEKLPHNTPFEVRVAAKGFATVRLAGIVLTRDERRDVGTLWLDRSARAEVDVRTWADQPVPGALVQAFASPTYEQDYDWQKAAAQFAAEPVALATATTDEKGRAVFPEIASGHWSFVATKPGFSREGTRQVQIRGGDTKTGIRIHLMSGHRLEGRCLDGEGKPLPGVVVIAGRSANAWDAGEAGGRIRGAADGEGRFRLENLGTGSWTVWGSRDGGSASMLARVRVPGVSAIDLVMAGGGRLEGTVTDADTGKPVAGAVVRAMTWGMSALVAEGATDAEGRYAIDPLPSATISSVDVSLPDYVVERDETTAMVYQPIPCGPGQVARKDLKVRRGGDLSGTVRGPDGPVSGAKVSVLFGSATLGILGTKSATTDQEGRFRMTGLGHGTAVITPVKAGLYVPDMPAEGPWQAIQSGMTASFVVAVEPGKSATAEVVMARGVRVSGRVETPEGPLAGARVTLFQTGAPADPALTAEDGSFAVDGVAPTPQLVLNAEKDGWVAVPIESPVAVTADGETSGVVLRMRRPATVRGRVISATGAPLADAQVWLVPAGGEIPEMMTRWMLPGGDDDDDPGAVRHPVRPDGTFEIDAQQSLGKVAVRATAAGHAKSDSDAFEITQDRGDYETTVTLRAGTMITGRVQAGGSPVPGARVSVSQKASVNVGMFFAMPVNDEFVRLVDTVAGPDGSFTAGPFADGEYKVVADARAFVEASAPAKLPGTTDVTLELEPELEITGTLTIRDGGPVGGAQVTATAEGARPGVGTDGEMVQPASATTAEDGAFRLRGLKRGKYTLTAQPQWNSPVNMKVVKSGPVDAGATDVRLVAEAGLSIAGRVVDERKQGVAGVWIQVNPEQAPEDGIWQGRGAMSRADGAFTVTGLAEGKYALWANQNMGGVQRRPVQKSGIAAGTEGLEIVMAEGLSIEGVALGEDGKPLASIHIGAQLERADGDEETEIVHGSAQTDGSGRFKVGGLAPGKYQLTGSSWNGEQKQYAFAGGDGVAAGSTGVVLRAVRGITITGKVVDEQGQPIAGVSLVVQSGQFWRQANSGADGAFELSGLPAGKVQIQAWSQNHMNKQVDAEAGARDVVITLEKGYTASGTLTNADGTPAGNVYIGCISVDKTSQTGAQTAADGTWTVAGLRDTEYTATAYIQGANGAMTPKEVGKFRGGDTGVTLRVP